MLFHGRSLIRCARRNYSSADVDRLETQMHKLFVEYDALCDSTLKKSIGAGFGIPPDRMAKLEGFKNLPRLPRMFACKETDANRLIFRSPRLFANDEIWQNTKAVYKNPWHRGFLIGLLLFTYLGFTFRAVGKPESKFYRMMRTNNGFTMDGID